MRRLLCVASVLVLSQPVLAQPNCSSIQGGLVEIGDVNHPEYPGITFVYNSSVGNDLEVGGVVVGDFNNDGIEDVLLPGGLNQANALYQGGGAGTFSDVTVAKGLSDATQHGSCGLFLDYDNDGDLDILIAGHEGGPAASVTKLYRNAGVGGGFSFHDVSTIAEFSYDPNTIEASLHGSLGGVTAGDYDIDGFPDIFFGWWYVPQAGPSVQHDMWRLFRNTNNANTATNNPAIPTQSPRRFVDKTLAAGLNVDIDKIPDVDGGPNGGDMWQPSFVDINNDGYPDLHVNVDFGADFMFINNQDGTFTDRATEIGMNGNPPQTRNEMGASFADVDNDGDLDVQLTNVALGQDGNPVLPKEFRDRFFRNDSFGGVLKFTDMGTITGVINSEVGWGTIAFDFDNDGDLDHAIATGMRVNDDPHFNRLHINQYPQKAPDGISPLYCDASLLVPEFSKAGTPADDLSRAIVSIDLDSDGDLDLLVGKGRDSAPGGKPMGRVEVYKNTLSNGNDWVRVDLVGDNRSLNTINARLWLRKTGVTQHRQIVAGSSFHGFESPRQHFGLGPNGAASLKWLVVRWPVTGTYQYVSGLNANQANTVTRSAKNDLGDLNLDGAVNVVDLAMLELLITDPVTFDTLYPDSPARVLGDCDEDNTISRRDLTELTKLLTSKKI